jgi:hypothetical protein
MLLQRGDLTTLQACQREVDVKPFREGSQRLLEDSVFHAAPLEWQSVALGERKQLHIRGRRETGARVNLDQSGYALGEGRRRSSVERFEFH